jgi:hypothetical protein
MYRVRFNFATTTIGCQDNRAQEVAVIIPARAEVVTVPKC